MPSYTWNHCFLLKQALKVRDLLTGQLIRGCLGLFPLIDTANSVDLLRMSMQMNTDAGCLITAV